MTTVTMIPKEISCIIPNFGGNKRHLNLFLRKCDYVINKYRGNAEQDQYVLHVITSKLTDEAAALVSERIDIVTWEQLKTLLNQHFGDPRSEECIAIELETLKIKQNESYLDFCNRVQSVRSVLISKVNQLLDASTKMSKTSIYNNLALNVFLYNLPENLLRAVRMKMPTTLEKALEFVLEDVNFYEQYNIRHKMLRSQTSTVAPIQKSSTQFSGANSYGTALLKPSAFRPNFSAPQQFKFGIPGNIQYRQPFINNTPTHIPTGYRPNIQTGYSPQFMQSQQQFMPRFMQPQGFNTKQQFGYRPQNQFGYKSQTPQKVNSDVTMRTVTPKQNQPQGFRLNELELDNPHEYETYDQDLPHDYDDGYYPEYIIVDSQIESPKEYDFETKYKVGKQKTNADALSPIKVNAIDSDSSNGSMDVNVDETEQKLQKHIKDLTKEISKLAKDKHTHDNDNDNDEPPIETIVLSDTSSDKAFKIFDNEPNNYPLPPLSSSSEETIPLAEDREFKGIPIMNEAVDTKPNQILIFTWFRKELQVQKIDRNKQKILEVFMPLDDDELVKQFLKEYIKPKTKYFIYFEDIKHRKTFNSVFIKLFKEGTVELYECTERVISVEDENEQRAIVLQHHEGKTCHRGIKETIVRIKRNYYWPNMQDVTSAVINACETCRKMKYDRKPIKPKVELTQTQSAPFQEVFIDIFSIENQSYLTIVDAFSKLGQALEIENKSTPEVVRALIKYFSMYGVPNKINSDPGSEFNNELMKEFASMYKIELHICTPNNPNSTGIVERFHSTLIEIYRLAKYEQKCTDAASIMTYSLMAYNNTIHSTTELTPFEIVFGHTDSNKLFDGNFDKMYMQQLLKDHAKRTKYLYKYISDKMIQKKEHVRENRVGEHVELEPGDIVYTKDINTRKSKDKPRYKKAKVMSRVERNIASMQIGKRNTKVPIKNVKRPPQVVFARSDTTSPVPGPSTSKD